MKLLQKITSTILVAIVLVCPFACASLPSDSKEPFFSVNYIDVGNGDCILVTFPDGKNMLIDTGEENVANQKRISNTFKNYSVTHLDYLLLTHTDVDHIGNALYILQNYSVTTAYIPYVKHAELFYQFNLVEQKLLEKDIEVVYFDSNLSIESDYKLYFLSPIPTSCLDSPYNDFNATSCPSEQLINDISAVVYLEYKGIRFLFTGDISYRVERDVVDNYKCGIYSKNVKLENIDYLKVAHHGSSDSSSLDFLSLVCPINAVISVGASNNYSHPSTATLERLLECNSKVNILRTDVCGDVSITIDANGNVKTNN